MTTDLVKVLPTEDPPPKPAWKVRCPYCGGTGWRDTGDGGGWKCSWCSGTGWFWTDGGAW